MSKGLGKEIIMAKKATWYRFTFADGYVTVCRGISTQEHKIEDAKHDKLVSQKREV